MKKNVLFAVCIFLIFLVMPDKVFAENQVSELILENGMSVYLLEDNSTPLVRIEYICRAGTAFQTPSTNGYFSLYTQLFKETLPQIQFSQVYCDAEAAHYVLVAPSFYTEEYLELLAQAAFSMQYSDQLLESAISKLKNKLAEDEKNPSAIINGAIDSRVFSAAPWKHESGAFADAFGMEARSVLQEIADFWYTPQNSVIFISGNIDLSQVARTVKSTFGSYYSNYRIPAQSKIFPANQQRKYVFHSPALSPEITQIVMQYTSLDFEEAELIAQALNENISSFKAEILQDNSLLIPGSDYINAAAGHKNDSSRVIIQSILQKNKKLSSTEQVLQFLKAAKEGIQKLEETDMLYARQTLRLESEKIKNDSFSYMKNISDFWVHKPFLQFDEIPFINKNNCILTSMMDYQQKKIEDLQLEQITPLLVAEEPFVFILINSEEYKKYKNDYKKAGFEEINSANAFWYNQKMYESVKTKVKKNFTAAENSNYLASNHPDREVNDDNDYFQKNAEAVKIHNLSNGISLFSKYNGTGSEVAILLSVEGGRLNSADEDGFEEVMINLLTENIQKEIYKQQLQMNIIGSPKVDYECNLCSSFICLECEKTDFYSCCKAISNAIVYGEVIPSSADRAVAYVQYNKRIENAGAVSQLYYATLKKLYTNAAITRIYNTQNEILTDITYQRILAKYQDFLDASRYSVILTGNFDSNYFELAENTFGLLNNAGERRSFVDLSAEFPDKNKNELYVKVNHKFFANPLLDKNAPMPSVLIPTTDFTDPAIYVLKIPPKSDPEFVLFEALLLYLSKMIPQIQFSIIPLNSQTDFTGIVFQNVSTKAQAEDAYKNLISALDTAFSDDYINQTVQKIKDNWISEKMTPARTNAGTAKLLQKGLEFLPYQKDVLLYLKDYKLLKSADSQNFLSLLQYFMENPYLKVYSQDTK